MQVFECIPNVSEGRDATLIDACAAAIESCGVRLAHRTSDAVHHRSVFTFFGSGERVIAAAVALARVTTAGIDLREHRGAHPRMGALDVLPFVPFGDATSDDAVAVARAAARRIWETCGVPSVFYGAAATAPGRRSLADVRAGGFEALQTSGRRDGPSDVGSVAYHPRAGAIAVGAREPLVAFNVVLASGDLELARAIARRLRERDGGLRTLRCLAVRLDAQRVQVSCNVTDPSATPLSRVFGLIRTLAARGGASIERSELIGLVGRDALATVAAHALGVVRPVPTLAATCDDASVVGDRVDELGAHRAPDATD
ncbi:MAG: glutamate formimidoyltransferase [Vulcanimicrobiaceae bacterium]